MNFKLFTNNKVQLAAAIILIMSIPSWSLLEAGGVYSNLNLDRIVLTPPCYIIRFAEVQELDDAKSQVSKLTELGYQSGYVWRPDYRSLEGSQSYYVYIGPFQSVQSCENYIDKYLFNYMSENKQCVGILVANSETRFEIKGKKNVKVINEKYPGIPGIYPNLSFERIDETSLTRIDVYELKIMKNEVLARKGYKFKTQMMKEYFLQQPWYVPVSDDVTAQLSDIERENVQLLSRIEKERSTNEPSPNTPHYITNENYSTLPPLPPDFKTLSASKINANRQNQANANNYDNINANPRFAIVISDKAYFYNALDYSTKRKAYLIKGEQIFFNKKSGDFIYVHFTNNQGVETIGWMLLSDFKELDINALQKKITDSVAHMDSVKKHLIKLVRSQTQTLSAQDELQNTAYYVIGTNNELRKYSVVKEDEILADFNKELFTKIDIRKTIEISILSKRVKILSNHPSTSYKFIGDKKIIQSLQILDYKAFWSNSKYLVIEVY